MKANHRALLDFFLILIFSFLSLFPYAGNFSRWKALVKEFYPNLILVSAVFFSLCFILEVFSMNSPSYMLEREFSIFSRIGKLLVAIAITYILESTIFFSHSLGRKTYLSFFLLSFIYSLTKKPPEPPKVLWRAEVPIKNILGKYRISSIPVEDISMCNIVVMDGKMGEETLKNIIKKEKIIVVSLEEFVEYLGKLIPLEIKPQEQATKEIISSEKPLYERVKRLLEVPIAIAVLLTLFPPAFLLALIHQIESPGPIFYLQKRLGKGDKEFKIIKFRTMIPNAEPEGKPVFASRNDPRITRIGRIIRKLHLDEVPQLINVIKGDMSLVGPRPERPEISRRLERELKLYPLRRRVKPGVTGWAQIHFGYAGDDLNQHLRKLEYDLYYIKHRNLSMDLHILYRTLLLFLKPAVD